MIVPGQFDFAPCASAGALAMERVTTARAPRGDQAADHVRHALATLTVAHTVVGDLAVERWPIMVDALSHATLRRLSAGGLGAGPRSSGSSRPGRPDLTFAHGKRWRR